VVKWSDIFGDAELYPGVPGIQALKKADKELPTWVYTIAARVDAEEQGR